jgi:hypothetical protein
MRERKSRLFPVALSPERAAGCIGVRPELIRDAIRLRLLPCYKAPRGSRRIVLVRDLLHYIRREWKRV